MRASYWGTPVWDLRKTAGRVKTRLRGRRRQFVPTRTLWESREMDGMGGSDNVLRRRKNDTKDEKEKQRVSFGPGSNEHLGSRRGSSSFN